MGIFIMVVTLVTKLGGSASKIKQALKLEIAALGITEKNIGAEIYFCEEINTGLDLTWSL